MSHLGALAKLSLHYIGIDEDEWNPESDSHIACKFSVENFKTGKAKNKEALQKELGLPLRPDVPLVGFIGRLDYQKGADLVLAAAPWLVKQDCQVVCLGTGDSGLEVLPSNLLLFFPACLSSCRWQYCLAWA